MPDRQEFLFVYGTLKSPRTQKMVFGRSAKGESDFLDGYARSKIIIGGVSYPIVVPDSKGSVSGLVLAVTPKELLFIDAYETKAYKRKKVKLRSGKYVWVYRK